ncbi:His-Xaa-Ser system protein HxsD [Pseudomonas mosselii]|uniref:His-Xaa-Ser system protein HxsD n=1 Tax=Pseudomonas mosselii TaxID=78327 RepID=A0ABX9B088_9PSED|nr:MULTISPECIES: His-Xaa-Ser system protein HxsD [Pseudomonas]MDH1512685.1 His-Xaa-Ser system protein HxsD [Pseudomonas mosselii]OWQ37115.1 His-Xaa-Ser system protein HxsD [Pseudomonas sp. DrBHI1]QZP24469.1 His-Xaa-Ser system protein HxsD [Pseudomonas mosselii]
MTWPVILKLDSAAYSLSVVQRTAYALAETVAIQIGIEADQISLTAFPAKAKAILPQEQAHSLILQHLNDFALRDHINRETAGLREVLARAALAGCGVSR